MKLRTEELQTALSLLNQVPTDSHLDSSMNVQMRQEGKRVRLCVSGRGTAVAYITPTAGTLGKQEPAFSTRHFAAVLGAAASADKDTFDWTFGDTTATAKIGSQKIEIALAANVAGYPDTPKTFGTKHTLPDDTAADMGLLAKFLDARAEEVYAIVLNKSMAVASDRHHLLRVTYKAAKLPELVLPYGVAKALEMRDDAAILKDKRSMTVPFPGVGHLMLPQMAYPLEGLGKALSFVKSAKAVAAISTPDLVRALEALAAFAFDAESEIVEADMRKAGLRLELPLRSGSATDGIRASKKNTFSATIRGKWPLKMREWLAHVQEDCPVTKVAVSDRIWLFTAAGKTKKYDFLVVRA